MMSIMKMDKEAVHLYEEDPYFEQALEFVVKKIGPHFKQQPRPSSEMVMTDFPMTTSPGFPWTNLGHKTKEDALSDPGFWEFQARMTEYVPIWRVAPKTDEWLHIDDLRKGKIRTFIIPPVHFFLAQRELFYCQNEALKEFWWSAYGFNPYYGGTNRLAQELLRNPRKIVYDVRGWDRLLPIMPKVYSHLRMPYVKHPDEQLKEHVAEQTCFSTLLLPNGHLVEKDHGNNSGSGNTTTDNILAHMVILVHVLMVLFQGDEKMVEAAIARLFGDDSVLSIPECDITDEAVEEVFRRVFGMYGLELDPFVITTDLEKCEFLGFRFKQEGELWVPEYKLGRIAAAFAFSREKQNPMAQLSKMYSLMIMSAGSGEEVYNKFRAVYKNVKTQLKDTPHAASLKAWLKSPTPRYSDVINFYTGMEATSVNDILMEDGGINIIYNEYQSSY